MDTKLKDIRYSTGAKFAAAVIVCLCFVSAMASGIFLIYNNEIVSSHDYFTSYDFKMEYSRLIHNLVEYNVKLKSEEDIKNSGQQEKTIVENLDRFHRIRERLSSTVNLGYYIKNTQTGEALTNIAGDDPLGMIQGQPTAVRFNQWRSEEAFPLGDSIQQMLSGTPYEVSAAVIEPLKAGDVFYDQYQEYSRVKGILNDVIALLVMSVILMIAAFVYLVCVAGRREEGGEIGLSFVDRIYTDVFTVVILLPAVISVSVVGVNISGITETLVVASIVWGIDAVIGLTYALSMVRQFKKGQIIRNSLTYKVFHSLKRLIEMGFNGRVFKEWTLLLLLGYGLVNGILFASASGGAGAFAVLLIIIFNIAVVYFGAQALLSLTQIMEAVKEVSAGNLDYALDGSKISAAFAGLAKDIQSIQGGLKKAVAEAVKGERMKTDLITNVSHDLKTPLTSIVNYVDLLKKEDLNSEKAYEYVRVLEEKSARLKQLIDDLFEASRASSGSLAVKAEKVDLHELVMQACGEYEEKIKQAELDVIINAGEEKTLILADGKYMWRIAENLLSNVLKYSMPHSRVYIEVTRTDKIGLLVIKNISAGRLDISPEQLTERFVRGDVSRTTEGSGLGLSIAQSLTVIQGGRFSIEIDGDLFKAIVEMPLWQEG